MQQFDVWINPVARMRVFEPYVLVLQHARVPFEETVVVAPLSLDTRQTKLLSPLLPIFGRDLQLMTQKLTFFERSRLRGDVIDNLASHANTITRALDQLFNAAG